jgi:hypothetical protein
LKQWPAKSAGTGRRERTGLIHLRRDRLDSTFCQPSLIPDFVRLRGVGRTVEAVAAVPTAPEEVDRGTIVAGEGPSEVAVSRLRGACRTTEAAAAVPTAVEATDGGGAISTSLYEPTRTFTEMGLTRDAGDGLLSFHRSCFGRPCETNSSGDKGEEGADALGEPAPTDEGESAAGMGVAVGPWLDAGERLEVAAGPWLDAGGRLEEVGGREPTRTFLYHQSNELSSSSFT